MRLRGVDEGRGLAALVIPLAFALAACATAPSPEAPATPALPVGWTVIEVDDPGLAVAVPDGWEVEADIDPQSAPPPDPAAGPKATRIQQLVRSAWVAGGYRAHLYGSLEVPGGRGAPGYIEVFTSDGDWSSLDAFAQSWEEPLGPIAHRRIGTADLAGTPLIIVELDDMLESGGPAGPDSPHRLRARWHLMLLPDGRGMNVTVGTYDDEPGNDSAATIEALSGFADRVLEHLTLQR